jgi:hypothetical protein
VLLVLLAQLAQLDLLEPQAQLVRKALLETLV